LNEFFSHLFRVFIETQQELNSIIASNFREISNGDSLLTIVTILSVAFIYGVVHAIGPGHGKLLVSSYFLRGNRSYTQAFKMGYLISLVHTLSALTITFVLYYILEVIFSKTFQDVAFYMTKFSGVLIIGVAIYLFFEHHHEHKQIEIEQKSDLSVAISAGIVPCPGVMTITLFSIMRGELMVGIFSAILMSIGMGLTISLSAILATATQKHTSSKLSVIFPYIGNIMILLLGIYLLII